LLRWVKSGIHRFYQPVLHRALARARLSLALPLTLTLVSFPLIKAIGFSPFTPAGTPEVLVRIEMPQAPRSMRPTRPSALWRRASPASWRCAGAPAMSGVVTRLPSKGAADVEFRACR
jgi:hypothetical protein